jgi:hypothetical protein
MVLPNYEALPEHDQVVDPAREVTLFKVAVDQIDKTAMQQHYRLVAHGNPNYFIAYSNGKSLAKVLPGLRSHGAHRWSSYNGSHKPWTHPQAAVLHYTYNRCAALSHAATAPRQTCSCCAPPHLPLRRLCHSGSSHDAAAAAQGVHAAGWSRPACM